MYGLTQTQTGDDAIRMIMFARSGLPPASCHLCKWCLFSLCVAWGVISHLQRATHRLALPWLTSDSMTC